MSIGRWRADVRMLGDSGRGFRPRPLKLRGSGVSVRTAATRKREESLYQESDVHINKRILYYVLIERRWNKNDYVMSFHKNNA